MSTINHIINEVNTYEKIIIAGHTSPDGDAIGSALALAMALLKMGKNVTVLFESYSERYDFIPGKELVVFDDFSQVSGDLFISVDCGDLNRLGDAADVFLNAKKTINIDHHISNTMFADINYVVEGSSSTSEIMYNILDQLTTLDDNIAQALYTGIVFDTGGFKHSSTTEETFLVASKLLKYNVPSTQIYESLLYQRTYTGIKILGKAIDKSSLVFDNRVIYSVITLEDVESCNSSVKELGEIINALKSVDGTDLAIFFYQKAENVYKVSLRSSDNVDSCKIAQCFGGGGHVKASGCTIEGNIDDIINLVFDKVKEMI